MAEYPIKAAQVRMLELIQEMLDKAHESGELRVRLSIDQVGALGNELGIPDAAAVSMFCRLGEEGYFVATGLDKPFSQGFNRYPFMFANIDRLTTGGLLEIGRLPDPAARMLQSLEAFTVAIDERKDIEPKQKRLLKQASAELKTFLRGVPPGVAVEVGSAFMRGLWGAG